MSRSPEHMCTHAHSALHHEMIFRKMGEVAAVSCCGNTHFIGMPMYLKHNLHPEFTHTHTLIMLLLRGISDVPSRHTEVLLVPRPAWPPGVMGDPEASVPSDGTHSPFSTAASSLGMVASPRFTGNRLPSTPNSAIGAWSTPVHTCTRRRAHLYFRRTPGCWRDSCMRRCHSEARLGSSQGCCCFPTRERKHAY